MMAALLASGINIPDSDPILGEKAEEDPKMATNKMNSPRLTREGNLEGPGNPRGTFVICSATRLLLHWFAQLSLLIVSVIIIESWLNLTHMQTFV